MRCLECGTADLVHDTRDVSHTYRGETTLIPKVRGEFCPNCGEYITDAEESRRVMKAMNDFNKQINAATVEPTYVATVRKKLRLTQAQAGQIFGGGVNAFSRYERGRARPPLATVQLLRVLDKHPDLIHEIAPA